MKVYHSSKDHTWETPQELFDKLNNVFNFKIDVCALPETAKCDEYFTPEVDGLKQDWVDICWCNPPYGRMQKDWIKKARDESLKNDATIVMLIPAKPDTKIWHDVIFKDSSAVCFIKGRLRFGNAKENAPFPSAIVVFGNVTSKQIETLSSFGYTIVKEKH